MNVQVIDANTTIGSHPTHRMDMQPDALVAQMDAYHITASLVVSTIGVFHNHIQGNEATIEAARTSNRLVPVATVNPSSYFGTPADMQALRSQGFRIARFFPIEQWWPIDSAAFAEILSHLAPTRMPIMVDAARPGDASALGRMVADYPAPIVLCSVDLSVLSEALAVMARLPNVMIETHDLHVPGGLELLAERVGADRVVFGSGAPRRSIASSLQYVLRSGLSEEDKQRVLGGNIRRVLEAA